MDLHADVLARPERAPHPGQVQPDLLVRERQAGRDLLAVHMQPLGGHVQVDAAVLGRDRQPRLGPEGGLVLHAGLVVALHPDLGLGVGIPVHHADVAEDVAPRVELAGVGVEGPGHVREGLEDLVLHLDPLRRPAGLLGVLGGDDGHRLAQVPDLLGGQHRLVGELEAVRLLARDVAGQEHGVDAGREAPRRCRSSGSWRAGCGLRTVAPHSMPSAHRSLPYANCPLTLGTPSTRGR